MNPGLFPLSLPCVRPGWSGLGVREVQSLLMGSRTHYPQIWHVGILNILSLKELKKMVEAGRLL